MNAFSPQARIRLGGAALLLATLLFIVTFSYLATTFGYPDVLDRPAGEVLPALRALGDVGWAVWLIYGLIPLLLVPTAIGVREVASATAPRLARLVVPLAVLSAVSMMIGLLRWSTLHWILGVAAAAIGWLAMLRNLTPLVDTIAAANNAVLPLWMITVGAALLGSASARR